MHCFAVKEIAKLRRSVDINFQTLNDNNGPTFNQLLGINNESTIAG